MFHFFHRDIASIPHLKTLDCSLSKTLDENLLLFFLNELKSRKNPLERLVFTSCNICSRLPDDLHDILSDSAHACRLKHLDLSYNEISANDKRELSTTWQTNRRTSDVIIHGKKCLFTSNFWWIWFYEKCLSGGIRVFKYFIWLWETENLIPVVLSFFPLIDIDMVWFFYLISS